MIQNHYKNIIFGDCKMIEILIKMADSLDERGMHSEASKVDTLIRKIAQDLENDYL